MKTLGIIFIASILATLPLSAATAEEAAAPVDAKSKALAEELLQQLNAEQSFDQNVKQIAMSQIQAQPELAVFADVIERYYRSFIGYEALREKLVAQYIQRFSTEELTQLVEFYSSDLGIKSTQYIPQIATQALQEGTIMSQANGPLLEKMIAEKAEMLNME